MAAYLGFQKLKSKLAAKGKVSNPAAVAVKIGEEKYGEKTFHKAAAEGKKMKGMKSIGSMK